MRYSSSKFNQLAKKKHFKRYALKRIFKFIGFFYAIFSFWDMVDFVLNIHSVLVYDLDEFKEKFMLGELHPPKPPFHGELRGLGSQPNLG